MYGDTLTWGDRGLGMWSGDCQSNSGVRGYSDMGEIGMWSGDCQSNSGVRGYSDMGGDRNVIWGLSE